MKNKIFRVLLSAVICFALTYLLSRARFVWGLSPFYLGAYVSLLAIGGDYLCLSGAYLLARFAVYGTWQVVVQAGFAALGVGIVRLTSIFRRRRFHPFYSVISAFLGELPTMIFLPTSRLLLFFGNCALACLFALLSLRLTLRGKRRVLLVAPWELSVVLLFAFAFGAGAYGTMFFGVTPYYFLLAALLPVTAALGVGGGGIPLAFALGGAAISCDLLLPLGAAIGWVLCEGVGGRRIAALALPVAEGLVYLLADAPFAPLNFLLLASGALLAAGLPDSVYRKCGARLGRNESSAARALVNKARLDLGGKLGYVGQALHAMSDSLFRINGEEDAGPVAERISQEIARTLCAGCKGYRDCVAQGGGGTSPLFLPCVMRALESGRATICDLPPYLNGNCTKTHQLLDALNEAAEVYAAEKDRIVALRLERERMASETEGIAAVMEVLKREVRRVVTFDGKREKRILAELQREGITAYDVMVAEEDGQIDVTVTMEETRAEDPRALAAASRGTGVPLVPESVVALGAGAVSVGYRSAPLYDAVVGQAVRIKDGSEACGDTKTVTRLGGDRIMVALSDGMGSGEEANLGSGAAIALVENFYRTGVDERVVLPLINRLLTMRNDGSFQTLDMCVINLRTGEADFIKLSAPESVIKRHEGSEIVEGGALPLGILREVRPSISRRRLSSGEVVVLATDGVTDSIGVDGVVRVIESGRTNNPQTIADNIVRDASYVSSADDQTVVALRLFRRL